MFEALASRRRSGSIGATAEELDCSYRHLWGRLHDWEQALGRPIVARAKGRGVTLTEYGSKLLDARSRALARMAPSLDNIAAELEAELNRAAASFSLVRLQASHDLALARLQFDQSLARERYFLLCPIELTETGPLRDLCSFLAGTEFANILAGLPGYAPWQSGAIMPLEQGLPW